MDSFQGFAHSFLSLRLCTVLSSSENSYGLHLNFSVSKKKCIFKKPELPGSFSERCSSRFGEILISLHAEYLLHHLMSKHITPVSDLHHEDAEIRCVLPTVRSISSFSV